MIKGSICQKDTIILNIYMHPTLECLNISSKIDRTEKRNRKQYIIVGDFHTPLSIMNTFSKPFMSEIVFLMSDNLVWYGILSWKLPSIWSWDNVPLPSTMNIAIFRLFFTHLKVNFSLFPFEKISGASVGHWQSRYSSLIHLLVAECALQNSEDLYFFST